MKREDVRSSNIKSIGWENGKLEVEFANGSVHQYDCSQEEHRKFMESGSKGKHFHEHFRKRTSQKV